MVFPVVLSVGMWGHPYCCKPTNIRGMCSCTWILAAPCQPEAKQRCALLRIRLTPGIPLPFPESPLRSVMVKAIPTLPFHQSPAGPPVSRQQGCSSRHHFQLHFKQFDSKQLLCSSVGAKELRRWVWCQLGIHPLHGESLCDLQSHWHGQHGRGTQLQHCFVPIWTAKHPVVPGAAGGTQTTMVLLTKTATS